MIETSSWACVGYLNEKFSSWIDPADTCLLARCITQEWRGTATTSREGSQQPASQPAVRDVKNLNISAKNLVNIERDTIAAKVLASKIKCKANFLADSAQTFATSSRRIKQSSEFGLLCPLLQLHLLSVSLHNSWQKRSLNIDWKKVKTSSVYVSPKLSGQIRVLSTNLMPDRRLAKMMVLVG